MKRWLAISGVGLVLTLSLTHPSVLGFCGFYVAKADARLFNRASQVVLVRHDDKTVITMVNDFRGDPKEFAVVVPVPTFIEREQIHVTDKALVDHLDAYTSPRLVEYFDDDPCRPLVYEEFAALPSAAPAEGDALRSSRARALGVTIEAAYTVGEYDILILSAEQSDGLETWLTENGYKMPPGASRVLSSYIKQNMRFFVARVNLEEQSKLGYSTLRPLQVAFESPKFTLPIRLGTVNADGPQDLLVYTLTRTGRVETANYRTIKLPTGVEIPVYVKGEFGDFYKSMFDVQVAKESMRAVFLEYAWDMAWCDPCASDPLTGDELRELGVFWLADGPDIARPRVPSPAVDVFVTRLHVRYDGEHFPEDLVLQETADRENFQGRYVLRHPYEGDITCEAGMAYSRSLVERHEREAQNLASLTGWDITEIREKMDLDGDPPVRKSWWERLWKKSGL
ncbi:MAG TPA: DUF2330 domain-containing protein [Vicinamibacteria bacterium]|nr:DUF2330 domain-containing protein [Vicinamibacteria bacterium]